MFLYKHNIQVMYQFYALTKQLQHCYSPSENTFPGLVSSRDRAVRHGQTQTKRDTRRISCVSSVPFRMIYSRRRHHWLINRRPTRVFTTQTLAASGIDPSPWPYGTMFRAGEKSATRNAFSSAHFTPSLRKETRPVCRR